MWKAEQLAEGIMPKLFFAKEHSQLFYQPVKCELLASAYPAMLLNKDRLDAKALWRVNLSEVYLLRKKTMFWMQESSLLGDLSFANSAGTARVGEVRTDVLYKTSHYGTQTQFRSPCTSLSGNTWMFRLNRIRSGITSAKLKPVSLSGPSCLL